MKDQEIINIGKQVVIDEIEALNNTLSGIGIEFAEAVKLISESNKVAISGIGKSGLIGKKIAATLSSFGISSIFLHPVDALHGDIGMIQPGDVAILLSKSGNTEELIKFIPYLKMREVKTIAIVGAKNSYLAKNTDIFLDASVAKEACPFNLAPTNSSTVALALGDALAIAVMKYKKVTLEDFSKLHPLGQIGRNITLTVAEVMHKIDEIPTISELGTFKEAIIKMTNKPLGCVCCVNDKLELLGIITDGDVRRILNKYDAIGDLKVMDIITKNPVTVSESSLLLEALALMENRNAQINVLPVVDKNKILLGLIRIHDIIKSSN